MLPDLTHAVKSFLGNLGSFPEPLSLKGVLLNVNDPESYARAGFYGLHDALGGNTPTWSGESISDAVSMNLSTVWCCRRIISESVAFLPLFMMREVNGAKSAAKDHPMYAALHDEPNDEMTAMTFREMGTDDLVAGGNCYSRIIRRSGTDVAFQLRPIPPENIEPAHSKRGDLVYEIKRGPGIEPETITIQPGKPHGILHIRGLGKGLKGHSVIAMARHSIGAALSAEKYSGKFYAGGGRVPYVIEMERAFKTDEDYKRWRDDWNKFYGDSRNWNQAVITEPGMKYRQVGLSPEDGQFLETRAFNVPEICRWFLLSPDMVGDLSKATLNNMEQMMLRFEKMTLHAWLKRWEQELRRSVLTPLEKAQGYYFKHNIDGLLRGDFASRMAGYATALQNGFKNIDEVRDLEDDDPLENGAGKAHHIQLNMATVPGTGKPMVSEQGILDRMAAAKKPAQQGAQNAA